MKLIIPPKVSNTAPKPTKAQIVEALVERARIQFQEKQDAIESKRQVIKEQIEEEARKEFAKFVFEVESVSIYENYNRPHIDFHLKDDLRNFSTPKITALLNKLNQFQTSHFDEKATKILITGKLKQDNPLLGNDEVAKSLDAMLAVIFNTTPVIEA